MRNALLAALIALASLAAPAARAGDTLPPPDQIVLTVTEEAWVETETARVSVEIKTLITNEDARAAAANPQAILDRIGLGDWHVTGSYRQQTDTGFEQLLVVAEVRLPQTALSGIYERAKTASEKGRTVRVMGVDFSPSLAEREATAAKLRQAVYARAADEAKAVAAQFPDQGFRVHQVQFQDGGGVPVPMPTKARMLAMDARAEAAPTAGSGQQVSERMVLSASVVIAAPGR